MRLQCSLYRFTPVLTVYLLLTIIHEDLYQSQHDIATPARCVSRSQTEVKMYGVNLCKSLCEAMLTYR